MTFDDALRESVERIVRNEPPPDIVYLPPSQWDDLVAEINAIALPEVRFAPEDAFKLLRVEYRKARGVK